MQETQETPPGSLGQEAPWRRERRLCRWSCSWGQLCCCPRRPHCSLNPGQARCQLRGGKGTRGALATADTVILPWLISCQSSRHAVFSPLAVTQPTRRNTAGRRQVCLGRAHECPPHKAAAAQARPRACAQCCMALSRHIVIYQRGVPTRGGRAWPRHPAQFALSATRPSILAWEILCSKEPGGLHPWGRESQVLLSD